MLGGFLNPLKCIGIVKSLLSSGTEKTSEGKVVINATAATAATNVAAAASAATNTAAASAAINAAAASAAVVSAERKENELAM